MNHKLLNFINICLMQTKIKNKKTKTKQTKKKNTAERFETQRT